MSRLGRIRVAQIATTAGSVDFLLADHIARLAREGYDVEAVCAPDQSLPSLLEKGIRVQTISMVREPSPVHDLGTLRRMVNLFRDRRYDVVHSHTPKAGLLAPLAGRIARTPIVVHTVHGLLFHDRSPASNKVLGAICEYWTAGLSHRLLSQSREDMDVIARMRMKSSARVDYIGNGIDLERFHPEVKHRVRESVRDKLGIAKDEVVVGMVGRLVREKGFIEFFRAMNTLMSKRPNLRALVVGPPDAGQSDGITMEEATSILSADGAIWLGRRSDLPELFAAMDIFVLPSYREGIPRTAMEASAMELPIVTSNIRGCREVVTDQVTGLLVEPRRVDDLEVAIARLVDDERIRRAMGQAGRARIKANFDAQAVLDRLASYYERIVRELPPGGSSWDG